MTTRRTKFVVVAAIDRRYAFAPVAAMNWRLGRRPTRATRSKIREKFVSTKIGSEEADGAEKPKSAAKNSTAGRRSKAGSSSKVRRRPKRDPADQGSSLLRPRHPLFNESVVVGKDKRLGQCRAVGFAPRRYRSTMNTRKPPPTKWRSTIISAGSNLTCWAFASAKPCWSRIPIRWLTIRKSTASHCSLIN